MTENVIRINSAKNINAVNVDIEDKLVLESKQKQLIEYDILDSLLVAQQAELERQETLNFRVYGKVEYLSILNGVKVDFESIEDFFTRVRSGQTRNLFNTFDAYVVTPFTGSTSLGNSKYTLNYKVVATPAEIDLMYGSYGISIFGDKSYLFSTGIDINTTDQVDTFNKPIVKLYLFLNYKPLENGLAQIQTMERKVYDASSDETNFTLTGLTYLSYAIGDVIPGDLVFYEKENFLENMLNEQEYYITVPYDVGELKFKYRPFLEIKLKDFSSVDSTANISASTTTNVTIPAYAVLLDNDGNYLWRELLDFGFIEPDTTLGVDYPFLNGSHYVFNNLLLSMVPDLTHANTAAVFAEILFAQNELLNTIPSTDVDNLGNPC